MICAQHHLMPDTISQPQTTSSTVPASTSSSTNHSVSMNRDTNARRDAASMMMSMSHLMDAASLHAQQQQQTNSATSTTSSLAGNRVGGLPAAQSMINNIHNSQGHSHHNHTNRGPHKKRTASDASLLDDLQSNTRSGAAHSNHLINGGGVLRMPITGSTAASTISNTSSELLGKDKLCDESPTGSVASHSNASTNLPLTEEEKKAERRAANRRSAFQSRQRRKILIEDLQRTVAALSKDNDDIRSQLEAALLENRQLRQITSSLSAQAHAQQAQVAAQHAQQQHQQQHHQQQQQHHQQQHHQQQQQTAPGSQQQGKGSPTISAQQAPPIPSISQQQQPQAVAVTSAAPPSFSPQSLTNSTAALTNFLTSFSSQAAGAAPSSDQQQHIFNAKIALMAAQSRVSELEHHQAAQVQAAANAAVAQQQQHQAQLQVQAQAAASAALGLAHAVPGSASLSDGQHLARLQELLTRGISNASAAAASSAPLPVSTVATTNGGSPNNNTSISAAGVDLSHLRSLLEAQQQRQQQQQQQQQGVGTVQAPGPMPTAPESPGRPMAQERVMGSPAAMKLEADLATTRGSTSGVTSEVVSDAGSGATVAVAPQTSLSMPPTSPTSTVHPTTLQTISSQDAPGIQLLIESLRAGQSGSSGLSSAPPLDEAVRNYIKQQQMAQQQARQTNNAASTIKTESN